MDEQELQRVVSLALAGDVDAVHSFLTAHPECREFDCGIGRWLHLAASKGHIDMMKMLIGLGCEVDTEAAFGRHTPLSEAVGRDDLTATEFLLRHGADPNHEGSRNVIGAVTGRKQNSLEMLQLLERYGADLHKVFDFGPDGDIFINSLSMALVYGKQDAADYLRSRGCVMPGQTHPQVQTPKETGQPPDLNDEVRKYFAEHFGTVQELALIQIVPTGIPVAINCIPASAQHNYITLFTTGMSSEPMTVPPGMEKYSRAELFIQLPADWKFQDYADPNYSWPQHWLRTIAQHPSAADTWLGGPVVIMTNGEPAEPLAPNNTFTALMLMAERHFTSHEGHSVCLYRMTPLYEEERQLEIRKDIGALLRAFDRRSVPFIVDLYRPNVAR